MGRLRTHNSPMTERISTYAEFWPYYLREHSLPVTRWLHFLGTSCAVSLAATSALTGNVTLVPAALVSGYGFAWVSHFTLEKNRPATFKYPLWSLFSDFRMAGLMLVGIGCLSRLALRDAFARGSRGTWCARACATRMIISRVATCAACRSRCPCATAAVAADVLSRTGDAASPG